MKLRSDIRSPNFDPDPIAVEFVVVHYTALDLESTLKLLCDPTRKVSCHLVISEAGDVFELVPCLNGQVMRAWHAGESKLTLSGKEWSRFNDISIGIELENLNGNIFPYPHAQMQALIEVLHLLRELYPALKDPQRIVGHEQIAGFRGKCDPGTKFNWPQIYYALYPGVPHPNHAALLENWWGRSLISVIGILPKALLPSARINAFLERILAR